MFPYKLERANEVIVTLDDFDVFIRLSSLWFNIQLGFAHRQTTDELKLILNAI